MPSLRAMSLELPAGPPPGPGPRGLAWGSLRPLVVGRMLVASLALPSGLLPRPRLPPPPAPPLPPLVGGRMLVASLALPSGLLLRPDVTDRPVPLLAMALAAVAAVSVAWILGCRLGRGLVVQTGAQLGVDVA